MIESGDLTRRHPRRGEALTSRSRGIVKSRREDRVICVRKAYLALHVTVTCNSASPSVDNDDIAWLNVVELAGEKEGVEVLQNAVNMCVERWKAAGPEARKKMFSLFAVTGIFLSVCRHGHVLVMCDMRQSGELCAFRY